MASTSDPAAAAPSTSSSAAPAPAAPAAAAAVAPSAAGTSAAAPPAPEAPADVDGDAATGPDVAPAPGATSSASTPADAAPPAAATPTTGTDGSTSAPDPGAAPAAEPASAEPPADGAPPPPPPPPEGKIEKKEMYLLRWQIWDQENTRWNPYDPAKAKVTEEKEYPGNYFIVNVRYQKSSAKPELVIGNWSDRLLSFMRAVIGDEFFETEPTYPVAEFFTNLKRIKAKLALARALLEPAAGGGGGAARDFADVCADAEALGFLDAAKSSTTEEMVREYVRELVQHLAVFVAYVDGEFAPLARKLALMREYGHMEFDLLLYHFEEGQRLSFVDHRGRPDAFVLEQRYIHTDYENMRWVYLTGYAYEFDGDEYARRAIKRKIREYKGTLPLASLAAKELTDDLEAVLKSRGMIYTSMAGVYHKEYEGKRVILDPKAYSNREGYTRDPAHVPEELADEKLYLLPPDITGFNLANKVCPECRRLGYSCPEDVCHSWQHFDVTRVSEVVFDEHAWAHLVLDDDTKTLIEALVRVTDNSATHSKIISDVISGKGGGLISVLHGPPGTGKTLTAESIAEHLHRPMYMVGFSELSTTPDDLEANLKRILSLATAWDAVLLIDEADVFLEQRSLHELERNALVSVALRLLEYHRGVLFLTTNRITTFDEAFLSRFSIAIKYPELDHAGRRAIWRKFFELAGCATVESGANSEDEFDGLAASSSGAGAAAAGSSIAPEDLDALAEKPFNGRTIKNLVRTAQALALSNRETLGARHVKTVVRVQEKFLREFAAQN